MSSPADAARDAEAAHARQPVRRHLSERQADTVARLTDAAVEEVRGAGYDGLTVRNVARRAGVAPATAYTYFASKDHLVAEVFWRRLEAQGLAEPDPEASAAARVAASLDDLAGLVGDDPELAAAVTTAMLATDPDVARVREQIGVEIAERLSRAMGPGLDEARLDALQLALWGAMLSAGMGYFPHAELAARMADVTRVVLGD